MPKRMTKTEIQPHVRRIPIADAASAVAMVNPELAGLLSDLPSSFPLFWTEYPYGNLVFGPRNKDDHFGRFIPPCGPKKMCAKCRDVSDACADSLPLCIVLSNVVEEFLEYNEENVNFNSPEASLPRRFVPTRINYPGQMLGIIEFLNRLTAPKYRARPFRAPVRNASAGARSCFVSLSFRASELFRRLMRQVPPRALPSPRYENAEVLRFACANDNWLLLKLLAQAADKASGASPWKTRLLILPAKALNDFLRVARGKNDKA